MLSVEGLLKYEKWNTSNSYSLKMFASVVCDDLDCLVNDSLPSFEAESAQTLMEFDDFFNIDESEETECKQRRSNSFQTKRW